MKAKFEQRAFFRQVSKHLANFHACGATVGTGGVISAIKNHAGNDSLRTGQKYGRGFVQFEDVKLSNVSANSANLVVTTSRYDKIKKQTRGSITKTYSLTLVRGPSSIEGCYLGAVTDSMEKICNSIETATWNGSSCELTSPFNKNCSAEKALREINSIGNFDCCGVKWNPHPNQWCSGINFRQKTGCGGERTATGIKTPNIWSPSPSTICHGKTFTQTETCCRGFTSCAPNTKSETGTKCDSSCFTPPCPHGASVSGGVCACNPPPTLPPSSGGQCEHSDGRVCSYTNPPSCPNKTRCECVCGPGFFPSSAPLENPTEGPQQPPVPCNGQTCSSASKYLNTSTCTCELSYYRYDQCCNNDAWDSQSNSFYGICSMHCIQRCFNRITCGPGIGINRPKGNIKIYSIGDRISQGYENAMCYCGSSAGAGEVSESELPCLHGRVWEDSRGCWK